MEIIMWILVGVPVYVFWIWLIGEVAAWVFDMPARRRRRRHAAVLDAKYAADRAKLDAEWDAWRVENRTEIDAAFDKFRSKTDDNERIGS